MFRKQEKHRIAYIRRRIRKGLCSCFLRQNRKTTWISYHKAQCTQNDGCSSKVNQYSEVGCVRSTFSCQAHEIMLTSNFQNSVQSILYTCMVRLHDNLSMDIWRTSTLEQFVSNRVSDIIDVISPSDWRNVPTEFNAADLASRGTSVLSLMESSLRWSGAEWLAKPVAFWPHKNVSIMRTNLEEKMTASVNAM